MATPEKLIRGYRDFYQRHFVEDDPFIKRIPKVQKPKTLMVACSDSRVDPAILMDVMPGEMFSIRNVANLVPPHQPNTTSLHGVSAALEFGVCHLEVENIIVMGHSGCAGIAALRKGDTLRRDPEFSFIYPWMHQAEKAATISAREETEELRQLCCEQETIKLSLANLRTFPWIQRRVNEGTLALHGWYFRLDDGALLRLDEKRNGFVEV